jgi:hypothetical protein
LTNDYFGTLSFVGSSPLPNGTGGTNTFQIAVDSVTWGKTVQPVLRASGASLGTISSLALLFDADGGTLANPAGPTAPSWTASAVFTVSPGPPPVTIPLSLTGLPDASDEAFFGAPAMVGTPKPGPPLGPPLVFSCSWGKANPTASGQGVDYPGLGVCPEPFPSTPGFAGTALTGFSATTIFITGATAPEAAAAYAAVKWKLQEMPQTDTDADGVPDPPAAYFTLGTPPNNGYPVKGYFDNCPLAPNASQTDTGGVGTMSTIPDGIGDACQCGDVNNDGIVTLTDKTILARSLALLSPDFNVTAMPGFNKCSVTTAHSCAVADKTIIARALAGLAPGIQQQCHAATTFP